MADDESVVARVVPPITLQALVDAPTVITARIGASQGPSGPRGPQGFVGPAGRDGEDGVDGRPGRDGAPGGRVVKTVVGPLSGSRIVRLLADGEHVDVASPLDATHARTIVGVTLTSATAAEETVEIVRVGEVEDSAWSFQPGRAVFVGVGGAPTQQLEASWVFMRVVGVAVTPTKMLVDLRPPVFRAQ